ncbi:MAG: Na(+)-translocating NADH-quinone reductase subunit A [Bacteroidales bacterium]|nr:Na(+)-translocating NADH-quinone reductase subunit A [Bacteroidales bacterium]
MAEIKITKGLDIRLEGKAEYVVKPLFPTKYAIKPSDFHALIPRMLVEPGEKVKAGTPLFYNKDQEQILVASPVSGIVTDIIRGDKRRILEVRIDADQEIDYETFEKRDPIALKREDIVAQLLKSGVWSMLRQRPYGTVACLNRTPKAIFISCFDTAPLAPDFNLMVHRQDDVFQAGLDALAKLTSGKVHLNLASSVNVSQVFLKSKNVQINFFKGPHPAGNVGTQINKLNPVNKGEIVWYLRPQEVLTIGNLFLNGKYDVSRIFAVTGSEVQQPKYVKAFLGASMKELLEPFTLNSGELRYISGNVLTGTNVGIDGYAGFYDNQIMVIPEGDHYELLGWMMPRFKKYSFWHTYLSWLTPNKSYRLDTNLNGGKRAFVFNGDYEKVFPLDIYPVQLMKAAITQDIDNMEALGIYEVEEEDVALCEFICPSKIAWQAELRKGLDLMRQEME